TRWPRDWSSDVCSSDLELRDVSYDPHEIHLSALIRHVPKFKPLADLDGGPEEDRIGRYMDACDKLRSSMGSGDALALLSIMAIRSEERRVGKELCVRL